MISYYSRTINDDSLKDVSEIQKGVWIHAIEPSNAELEELAEKLSLETSILEDAQDFFEVPRLERSGGVSYFFTRYPFNEQTEDTDTAPLLIVIGDTFVLTITQREVPQFQRFYDGKIIVDTTEKTKLLIEIMQVITQSFERHLIGLRRSVQRDRVKLRKISNQEILRFVNYEHKLNDMVSTVLPTNVALQQIMSGNHLSIFDDDRELFDDLRIDNAQVVESARSLLKTIQNIRNAAEAILANNLNNRIKTLTVLTILLTIPTVISSLYGMNVPLPLASQPHAFVFVISLVIVTVSLGVWYFKKNEWL